MKVTILGTGTFYVNKARSGPAYLLEAEGKKILIDCGPGTLMRLSEIGVSPLDIDYIFISHFHADHTSDLFALLMNHRLNDFFGAKPLEKIPVVYGPKGIKDFITKLCDIYELHGLKSFDKIEYKDVESKNEVGNMVVKSFNTEHIAFNVSAQAYAYRFEVGDKVLSYSGDSIKCEGVEDAAKNADLFICDASYAKGKGSPAHMDTYEIGEIAQRANAKKVILTHFYPNTESVDLVAEVREKYSGEVARGKDLLKIEL